MTVKNRKEAWEQVNWLFPTDYAKDEELSQRTGYSIYKSTTADTNAWISDLNVALELNLPDGKSIRINIEPEPEIAERRVWNINTVRELCAKHNWYTEGSVQSYNKMLDFVWQNEPTALNIFKVAEDILRNSIKEDGKNECYIMKCLEKEACETYFSIG